VSVLVVHERPTDERRSKILVATDGSDGSRFAVETLAGFAAPEGRKVTVLAVAPDQIMLVAPAAVPVPVMLPRVPDEAHDVLKEQAREVADEAANILQARGFETETLVVEGHPADEILKEEASGTYEMVALGSRGMGPVRRALLGSVSDHVSRYAGACLVTRSRASS
jgi:nucleotide-binding universal stress UspA family protein